MSWRPRERKYSFRRKEREPLATCRMWTKGWILNPGVPWGIFVGTTAQAGVGRKEEEAKAQMPFLGIPLAGCREMGLWG